MVTRQECLEKRAFLKRWWESYLAALGGEGSTLANDPSVDWMRQRIQMGVYALTWAIGGEPDFKTRDWDEFFAGPPWEVQP